MLISNRKYAAKHSKCKPDSPKIIDLIIAYNYVIFAYNFMQI